MPIFNPQIVRARRQHLGLNISTTSTMSTSRSHIVPALRTLFATPIRQPLAQQQIRTAVQSANAAKYKRKDAGAKTKKRKGNTSFKQYDLKNAEQFALCDAMRYGTKPVLRHKASSIRRLTQPPATSALSKSAENPPPPSTKSPSS